MIAAELKNNFMEISDQAERQLFPQRFPDFLNEEIKRNVEEEFQRDEFNKNAEILGIRKVKTGRKEERMGDGMEEGKRMEKGKGKEEAKGEENEKDERRGEVEREKKGMKEGRGEDCLYKDENKMNYNRLEAPTEMDIEEDLGQKYSIENAGGKSESRRRGREEVEGVDERDEVGEADEEEEDVMDGRLISSPFLNPVHRPSSVFAVISFISMPSSISIDILG